MAAKRASAEAARSPSPVKPVAHLSPVVLASSVGPAPEVLTIASSMGVTNVVDQVRAAIVSALSAMARVGSFDATVIEGASWVIERPKRPEHGDFATNVAMVLSKRAGKPPRALAEALVRALTGGNVVVFADVAGPGFVNLRVAPHVYHAQVAGIVLAGPGFGRAPAATGERVNIEFVSANPTGPITVAAGRNAVLGDAVGRLLEAAGDRVTREYYVNDRGNQVRNFAESVRAAAFGREPPEDGYKGAYVAELAKWLDQVDSALLREGDAEALGRVCVTWMLRGIPGSSSLPGIRPSLSDLGVSFDVWFSEDSLYRWGAVPAVMRQLDQGGHLLRKDGALFFKAPDGAVEDKDRVVQKSDGTWAYFASDVAYFADKIARGYDRLINVLGADHHGYVARIRNALTALGLPEERFDALLYQLVFITKDGQAVKSSKRAGNVITVDEVMDEIDEAAGRKGAGADAIRFFFLSRTANSNVEFDIEIAKKKSLDNPVFYVQYGYARLCSIQRKARAFGFAGGWGDVAAEEWTKLVHPDELAMCHRLAEFPALVAEAGQRREPHRVVFYVQDLARDFQSYFTRLKGENDPILPPQSVRDRADWQASWDFGKTRARLAWIEAIRVTYAQALGLAGVSCPERMDRPTGESDDV
jgi:arginyl-tRNA synthetase